MVEYVIVKYNKFVGVSELDWIGVFLLVKFKYVVLYD